MLNLFLDTYLLKDGLNLNFHIIYGGQAFNIYILFFFCLP